MRRLATAVVLDVVGSAVVLVLLSLTWQRVRIDRQAPFADIAVGLSGRDVAPVVFGLALVTLAGAVAALATKGVLRRVVGVLVVLAGLGVVVVALLSLGGTGDARARDLAAAAVAARTSTATVVPVTDGTVRVTVAPLWPVLTAAGAVLTVAAGLAVLLPGGRGAAGGRGGPDAGRQDVGGQDVGGLGPRYEAPGAGGAPRDATWWSALDHGEDPTAEPLADPDPAGPDLGPTSVERGPDTR